MLTFKLFKGGLYLTEADAANPSTARVGFLFQVSSHTDPTFELNAASWADLKLQGFFCFFVPSGTRDWTAFASNVRAAFVANPGAQFAFFTDGNAGAVTPVTLLLVDGQGSGSPTLEATASFVNRNATLQIVPSAFATPGIGWDDTNNQFTIDNSGAGGAPVQLTIQPVSGPPPPPFPSTSSQLLLPMTGDAAGTINAAFQFATSDLDAFEAGMMFFAPPSSSGDPLTALHYPLLRAPGGASTPLNFSFWFDVLNALDGKRTYFQATDPTLGSYLAAANGKIFALNTTQTGPTSNLSRLVFSNRPNQTVSDDNNFYLAPAGVFSLAIDGQSTASASAQSSAILLCGITGTEFFEAGVAAGSADTLTFVPGQPAYASGIAGTSSAQLSDSGGTTVTSWVQFATRKGAYVSQPEQGPLFQQSTNAKVSLSAGNADANAVHLLDFLPLAAWQPNSGNGLVSSPPVPLVPYAGIPASLDLTPFRAMETGAINPTRKNAMAAAPHATARALAANAAGGTTLAMTPQGLLSVLTDDTPPVWTGLEIAQSPSGILQFTDMGPAIRTALNQNRIFAVISTLTGKDSKPLFGFADPDDEIDISDWIFTLSPAGAANPDGIPPILIFKFYDGQTIEALTDNVTLWSSPDDLNTGSFIAAEAQTYIQGVIKDAKESVAKDRNSLYANFVAAVTDQNFAGILALNCNLKLNQLPPAIQAMLGGMTKQVNGQTVSNVDSFRAHHVGIQINDTDPSKPAPFISQSSLFALVDYEKPAPTGNQAAASSPFVPLGFEVEYLRALFTNSELRSFACQVNLTLNQLFDVGVNLQTGSHASQAGADANIVQIEGSYQNHSSGSSEGEGVYSFVTTHSFNFKFTDNQYLDSITLDKLQFSFQGSNPGGGSTVKTIHIDARFAIWGSLKFNQLGVLDIFSFDKLAFANLGIGVGFDLTLSSPPVTSNLTLTFSPGDLRLDLNATTPREGSDSLLALLPFRLKSFLYSQCADQTLESLNYFSLGSVPGLSSVADTFNYALLFNLDLGSAGALVGSLAAFKFSFLIGWLNGGGVAFGVQMPEADGKLEIKIEGVIDLLIEEFVLRYVSPTNGDPQMLVVAMHNTSITILGKRMPPQGNLDFALFKPTDGNLQIGWIVAYNNESGDQSKAPQLEAGKDGTLVLAADKPADDGNSVLDIKYLGLGQRVGPSPSSPPTTFAKFLSFMTTDFWTAFNEQNYSDIYQPDGGWLAVADLKILKIVQLGIVFYDVTPFYSLSLNVENMFDFEITYTKVTDTIGLYYANLSLPEKLRTFQAGAASVTLPSLAVSVYTNGNWKLDLGFPQGDDWSVCFQVQCMVGPVPVTGAGGFYIASLSSATDNIFIAQYASILAFGLACRLGVGKDFTSGPLSAGVSITFFGIIEGATGYLLPPPAGSIDIFREPDALMLTGQFGLIGQIYGSIDFKIIKASVNVTLSASVGIILHLEKNVAGFDGSILLYVQASVSLSVSVSINLGLFSITISFSFGATFRFQWTLVGSSNSQSQAFAVASAIATARLTAATPAPIALCPGLTAALPLWFLPEVTVVFPDSVSTGTPYFALSLAIPFTPSWTTTPTYAQFTPFEALTAQMTTWALMQSLGLPAYNSPVTKTALSAIDQTPDQLVGFLNYSLLLQQLAVFTGSQVTVLNGTAGVAYNATSFPMPPFTQFATSGRLDGNSKPADLSFVFAANNLVSQTYLDEVDAYLNQLFVNQTQGDTKQLAAAAAPANIPLSQQIFLEYFAGLIRSGVHLLLQTIEDANQDSQNLDQLICAAVGAGHFASLAGQMSSIFRGGARLPYTAGLTVPGATVSQSTNPLYSLLWQQFPVGQLSPVQNGQNGVTTQYNVQLTQPDTTQPWLAANVNYPLTNVIVDPFTGLTSSSVSLPAAPSMIPFTSTGPQSFSFGTQTTWVQPSGTSSLRPAPSAMLQLTADETGATGMVVMSRQGGSAYLPDGKTLPANSFQWATSIQLSAKQIPLTSGGSGFLPNIYAISGASQADQKTLQAILDVLKGSNPIASIQVLYQSAAVTSGLNSAAVNPTDVFLLRTNTTTVSAPPVQMLLAAMATIDSGVAVGAQIDNAIGFLQILEQASVTNAPGYYLRYKDASGKDLPADLFTKGPAPLTILLTYNPDGSQNTQSSPAKVQPYYNSLVLLSAQTSLVYYAETVDPSLNVQYAAVAPGSVGAQLQRSQSPTMLAAENGGKHTHAHFLAAAVHAGVTDELEMRQKLAAAGAAPAQLNSLYSLMSYQVAATAGMFIASNLSAPIQPQAPIGSSSTAPRTYVAFVPLYALATANQGLSAGVPPNRYASIAGTCDIEFYLNDSFGNQLPNELDFQHTNLYFDSIVPLDRWQGIVASYDFGAGVANTVKVTLTPSQAAFKGMTKDQAAASLAHFYTIADQIGGPGVSFAVSSNLSLNANGSPASVTLTSDQQTSIQTLVGAIIAYLIQVANGVSNPPFTATAAALSVVLPATASPLPPAFGISVQFGIARSLALIDPSLIVNGVLTFPSTQSVSSSVTPTSSSAQGWLATLATAFAAAFPALALTVGLNGAQDSTGGSNSAASKRKANRTARKLKGVLADPSAPSASATQSFWAISQTLLNVTINSSTGQPLYSSPKPLRNSLESGSVPMPQMPQGLTQLGQTQTFVDVDLDVFNRNFFAAVDQVLEPASAAAVFMANQPAYTSIAVGCEHLATGYSSHEVDWLFNSQAPFTGSADQLTASREAFEQQLRAALMTAYSVDTIVQFPVQWNVTLPAGAAGQISLYGQVQPAGAKQGDNAGLSTAQIEVPNSGQTGLLTFLYSSPDATDSAEVSIALQLNLSHIQVFTEPAGATPPDEARPSLWLQLITSPTGSGLPSNLVPIGPTQAGTKIPLPTVIPVVFRQYPTPPTIISQSGVGGGSSTNKQCSFSNALTQAAAWHYTLQYQAQLISQDQLNASITYNSVVAGSNAQLRANALTVTQYTLFEVLCRFTAGYAILQPILGDPTSSLFSAAAGAFASLVGDVTGNSDWNPPPPTAFGLAGEKQQVTDQYTVTDKAVDSNRVITLTWEKAESTFTGASISVTALSPDLTPYPNQQTGTVPDGITDTYLAVPDVVDNWVTHQLEVDCLNVLSAENARPAIQIERNLISLDYPKGTPWTTQSEFVYMTPFVEATQPVTPFLDNSAVINVAQLPHQGACKTCPQSPASLCQRISTILSDLLTDPGQLLSRAGVAGNSSSNYRLKVGCSFAYPVNAAAGLPPADNPISPLVPIVLARSFDIDPSVGGQIDTFAAAFAAAISSWAAANQIVFGNSPQPVGGQLIFDVTLFAQLSGNSRPLLRLRKLQLSLSDVDPA